MFGDKSYYDRHITRLLGCFSLEEILEMLDLTEEEVLTILFEGGHAKVPEFVDDEWIPDDAE